MTIEITDWHWKNPNYWCAIDRDTNELIAAHINLQSLDEYITEHNLNDRVVYCTNWFRPTEILKTP